MSGEASSPQDPSPVLPTQALRCCEGCSETVAEGRLGTTPKAAAPHHPSLAISDPPLLGRTPDHLPAAAGQPQHRRPESRRRRPRSPSLLTRGCRLQHFRHRRGHRGEHCPSSLADGKPRMMRCSSPGSGSGSMGQRTATSGRRHKRHGETQKPESEARGARRQGLCTKRLRSGAAPRSDEAPHPGAAAANPDLPGRARLDEAHPTAAVPVSALPREWAAFRTQVSARRSVPEHEALPRGQAGPPHQRGERAPARGERRRKALTKGEGRRARGIMARSGRVTPS